MSAFQNQQPLNPVSPMVSQHIAEGDKAAAREKDRQESARQANMQDATTRQMTREQIMARQQGFADKQASDERMQRNAQEFAAIQSTQDREFQEKIAKRTLMLEQKKQEAMVNAARASAGERERFEDLIEQIEDEEAEIAISHIKAKTGLVTDETDAVDRAGFIADRMIERSNDLDEITDRAKSDAANLPFVVRNALAERFNLLYKTTEGATKSAIMNSLNLAEGDDAAAALASVGVNLALFADRGFNAVLDALDIPYQGVGEGIREDVAAQTSVGKEAMSQFIADSFIGITAGKTLPGQEQDILAKEKKVRLEGLVTDILYGRGEDTNLIAELKELEIDPETFGSYVYEQANVIRGSAFAARGSLDPSDENFQAQSAVPQSLIDASSNLEAMGRRLRGMTSARLRSIADRISDRDTLLTMPTVRALEALDPGLLARYDDDQAAPYEVDVLEELITRGRDLDLRDLERVEETAEAEKRMRRLQTDAERAASLAGLEAGLIDYEELFR